MFSNDIISSVPINNNEWSHLNINLDLYNSNLTFFVNGSNVGEHHVALSNNFSTFKDYDFNIGYDSSNNTYFDGSIDSVQLTAGIINSDKLLVLSDSNIINEPRLLSAFRFDSFFNNICLDESSYCNNGTLINGVERFTPSYTSNNVCLDLESVNNEYVSIPSSDKIDYSLMTLNAWVNTSNNGNTQTLLHKDDSFTWGIDSNGYNYFESKNIPESLASTIKSTSVIPNNTWTHLSTVVDGYNSKISFYQDGVFIKSNDVNVFELSKNNSNLLIGWNGIHNNSSNYYYSITNENMNYYLFTGENLTNSQNPTITIKLGDKITFANDTFGHPFKISKDNIDFKSEEDEITITGPYGIETYFFKEIGTYNYVCTSHSSMSGTINVINNTNNNLFNGKIDDLLIYDKALNETQILNLSTLPESSYSVSNINSDEWVHIAATYNNTDKNLKLYQNSENVATYSNYYVDIGSNDNPVNIGRYNNSTYYSGIMDDVRIYNKVLDQQGINNLYELNTYDATSTNPEHRIKAGGFIKVYRYNGVPSDHAKFTSRNQYQTQSINQDNPNAGHYSIIPYFTQSQYDTLALQSDGYYYIRLIQTKSDGSARVTINLKQQSNPFTTGVASVQGGTHISAVEEDLTAYPVTSTTKTASQLTSYSSLLGVKSDTTPGTFSTSVSNGQWWGSFGDYKWDGADFGSVSHPDGEYGNLYSAMDNPVLEVYIQT